MALFSKKSSLPAHPPAGATGEGEFLVTKLEEMVAWARSNSLWPFPFATACCGIEFMSVAAAHYDIARFGSEVVRFSPRQADLLVVAVIVPSPLLDFSILSQVFIVSNGVELFLMSIH